MSIEKISTLVERILSEINKVLSFIKEKDFEEFVENVLAAKRIFITGSGRSGILARAFAMRLMQTGCAVYVVGETTVPPINKGDLLIAVSGSGNTDSTKLILEKAKRFGASTYLITARENSPIADVADRKIV
ncbi:SIS domain-containing protein, partial [Candidatus Aerophobetes bacterium]|nr:SIS domain-containing protein [Candidatus Aerophobetes bacterium]